MACAPHTITVRMRPSIAFRIMEVQLRVFAYAMGRWSSVVAFALGAALALAVRAAL